MEEEIIKLKRSIEQLQASISSKSNEFQSLNEALKLNKIEYDLRKSEWAKKIISLQVQVQSTQKELDNALQEISSFSRRTEEAESRADQYFQERFCSIRFLVFY